MSLIKLPNLLDISSHFQLRVNSNYEIVSKEARKWTLKYAGKLKPLFEKVNLELLSAYLFPEADREQFRACCDLVSLYTIYDDLAEESYEIARKLGDEILSAIYDAENVATGLGEASRDVFKRIKNFSSPSNFNNLVDILSTQIDEVCAESKRREDKIILDFDSYVKVRPFLSGAEMVYAMIPCVSNLKNAREIFSSNEIFNESEAAAIEMGWIGNDIFSFAVEYAKNVHDSNIITTIMKSRGCSLQQAVDEVGKMFEDRMSLFMQNKKKILANEEFYNMRKYFEILETMVIGKLVWSSRCVKYNPEN